MSSSSEMGRTQGEFSVCQFFRGDATANPEDSAYEYVRRWVGGQEAVDAFFHYCTSVGAQLGWTVRVILTDGGDCINMEWTHADGITYPTEHKGRLKGGIDDRAGGPGVRESSAIPASASGDGSTAGSMGRDGVVSVESEEAPEAGKGSGRGDSADEG